MKNTSYLARKPAGTADKPLKYRGPLRYSDWAINRINSNLALRILSCGGFFSPLPFSSLGQVYDKYLSKAGNQV